MKNRKRKIGAVVLFGILFGTLFFIPANSGKENTVSVTDRQNPDVSDYLGPFIPDRKYILDDEPAPMTKDSENPDAGTKRDAGDDLPRATPLYPGECIDNTPGRGRTGTLASNDDLDWYFFSISEGSNPLKIAFLAYCVADGIIL